jgi:TonB family protein
MTVLRLAALIALSGIFAIGPLQSASERPLHVPFMPESRILHKASPVYPLAAVQHRIQGSVWFSVLIGKDGLVEGLRVISGHPLLIAAAREAAQQWAFQPATVGGVPVRVVTRIEIHFSLETYLRPAQIAANKAGDPPALPADIYTLNQTGATHR